MQPGLIYLFFFLTHLNTSASVDVAEACVSLAGDCIKRCCEPCLPPSPLRTPCRWCLHLSQDDARVWRVDGGLVVVVGRGACLNERAGRGRFINKIDSRHLTEP